MRNREDDLVQRNHVSDLEIVGEEGAHFLDVGDVPSEQTPMQTQTQTQKGGTERGRERGEREGESEGGR